MIEMKKEPWFAHLSSVSLIQGGHMYDMGYDVVLSNSPDANLDEECMYVVINQKVDDTYDNELLKFKKKYCGNGTCYVYHCTSQRDYPDQVEIEPSNLEEYPNFGSYHIIAKRGDETEMLSQSKVRYAIRYTQAEVLVYNKENKTIEWKRLEINGSGLLSFRTFTEHGQVREYLRDFKVKGEYAYATQQCSRDC